LKDPLVSVIVLNYNGLKTLGNILSDCIHSVLQTDYPAFEVLFVDNASTDGSVDAVKRKFGSDSKLKIVQNSQNLGFAEGNNVGMRQAQGEYIVLLNSDTMVEPAWLKALVKAVEPSEVGAAQSKLLLLSKPNLMDCAGGLVDFYGYHLERGRGEESSLFNKTSEIFYAKGASMILKRSVLEKSGLFDPDIFMYYDETDLCWRIRLAGFKVIYVPDSVVYHAAGLTTQKVYNQKKLFFAQRNHLMVLTKNYNGANMVKAVSVSVFNEVRNALLCFMRRQPFAGLAIVRALVWNLSNFRGTWKKRRAVQELIRNVTDEKLKQAMLKPYPPFPLYLVFSRTRYLRNKIPES
jgi:GT2 family glycosyltransferase